MNRLACRLFRLDLSYDGKSEIEWIYETHEAKDQKVKESLLKKLKL